MRVFAHCWETLCGPFRRIAARLGAPAVAATAMLLPAGPLSAQNYEIWALDQGTNIVHIYNAKLEEVGRIDMGTHGMRVPHMIHFTSDHAYAQYAAK